MIECRILASDLKFLLHFQPDTHLYIRRFRCLIIYVCGSLLYLYRLLSKHGIENPRHPLV